MDPPGTRGGIHPPGFESKSVKWTPWAELDDGHLAESMASGKILKLPGVGSRPLVGCVTATYARGDDVGLRHCTTQRCPSKVSRYLQEILLLGFSLSMVGSLVRALGLGPSGLPKSVGA